MPGLNGIELMSKLADRSPSTSFILMTGAPTFADRNSHAVEARLTTVLAKHSTRPSSKPRSGKPSK